MLPDEKKRVSQKESKHIGCLSNKGLLLLDVSIAHIPAAWKKKKKTIYSESLWLMMGHGLAVCGPDFPSLIPSKRRVAGVWQVLQDFLF